ncbi:MAG: hypothetical protein GQ569_11175 [Methylococcaceae bacterium]|nr:hypothetical protein [Methylococcaceae bacterium]
MKKINCKNWLIKSLELANQRPTLWLGYVIFLALVLMLGRVSLALTIFISVTGLFAGVNIAEYIDRSQTSESLISVLRKKLSLSFIFAAVIVVLWFIFRIVANLNAGEPEKILQFFYHWELTAENFQDKPFRQLIAWLYSGAIVALIFALLMLNSLANWFSYPLMVFKHHSWTEAREAGTQLIAENQAEFYKLFAFLLLMAFIGIGLIPLLTPLFFMLVSTLMYVCYRESF